MGYNIINSRGTLITTVSDVTINTATPLQLIGRGVAGYGQTMANNLYHMLENWASNVAPPNPATGMTWYDSGVASLRVWDGTTWSRIASASNGVATALDTLPGAATVNFGVAGTTPIYTGPTGKRTMVTGCILVPNTGASVTSTNPPTTFQMEVAGGSMDVMDKVALKAMTGTAQFAYFMQEGVRRIVQSGDTINFVVDTPLTAPDVMTCNVLLFGHMRA